MITITDIIGESVNLRTGEETPRGLLISNGLSTGLIHVSDDDMQKIVEMWAETRAHQGEPIVKHFDAPPPVPVSAEGSAPLMFEPERDVSDEDDYDPGEGYEVKSI